MGSPQSGMEHLRNKPQPRSEKNAFFLLALLGSFVLLIGGALLIWQVLTPQISPAGQASVISTPTAEPTKAGSGDPQAYYDAVKQYVAQQLHLSVAQIKAKLQAGTQTTNFVTLAEQQGIAPTQLRTILLEAEQRGHDILVQGGYLTQQQSDAGMQDLRSRDLQTLATSIKYDFLDH